MVSGETHLVGDLSLSDSLHIDGSIKGNVKSASDVIIGKTGSFEGDLSAVNVIISGRFQGNISAQRMEIVAGGRVDGEVEVAELVIESGGHFNGSSRIRSEAPRRLSYSETDAGDSSEDVLDLEPEDEDQDKQGTG